MKTTTINGQVFEIVPATTRQGQDIINVYNNYNYYQSWYDLYKRPSYEKEAIRKEWEKFFDDIGAYGVGYRGNCSTFSIYAKDDDRYFHITKSHNYVVM